VAYRESGRFPNRVYIAPQCPPWLQLQIQTWINQKLEKHFAVHYAGKRIGRNV
jgi:predicted DNA-binding transcriptional regulator AlpA